ncbi:MAG TPA: IclR family transcriptional regulator [Candidatus Cybelea sp.]|nr:IclR family transcriptional regulator [Candidatus Cybelea sp.]
MAKDRQFVTALARGLGVLRIFESGETLLGNAEISDRTGLPRPTVSRLTHTLTELGYLVFEGKTEKYRIGSAVLSLARSAISSTDLRRIARPRMQAIADFARSSCALGDCLDLEMIYIENCHGKGAPFTVGLDVGSSIPLATTAMGRAYLAGLQEKARAKLIDRLAKQHGKAWPPMRKALEHALREYTDHGFVLSLAEWMPEINSVGVPVLLRGSGTTLALNCGGAASILPAERLKKDVGPRLATIAREIEALADRQ